MWQLHQTVEIKNKIRRGYLVFSLFYFSAADKNKKEAMIYGLIL